MFGRSIELKTRAELTAMRRAGLVVAEIHRVLQELIAPGITTRDLDEAARQVIADAGATSNFLGYYDFPAVICVSVNDEIVHGIPGDRLLVDGDLVSVDCGAVVDGWHADAAFTMPAGSADPKHLELVDVTTEAMWRGIAAARVGGRVGDISQAIESYVTNRGRFGITSAFTGHGIGTALHQDPDVPNRGRRGKGPKLEDGIVLAIEPMITLGSSGSRVLADGWTAITPDGSYAAHVEHTVAITSDGLSVLTAPDQGAERLASFDIPLLDLDQSL